MTSTLKKLVSVLIVLGIIFVGYLFIKKPEAPEGGSLLKSNSVTDVEQANAATENILALLNQITSLQIEGEIFKQNDYKSLFDFSQAIPDQEVGRNNPFAPLPGSFVPTAPTSTPRRR
ncbi:MAG: hypothetical protein M3Q80_02945 [bacterium]|nr:hypothetical protein [bacterium]